MCLRSPLRLVCPRETRTNTFSGGANGKESVCNAGDLGSVPGWGRSPGEGNGYIIQYSCLENSMGRGDWHVIVHGVTKVLDTTE